MKLYALPGACSLAAHIALHWVAAEFELVMLTPQTVLGEEYRAINPKAAVPTLILDDGTVITEALAVLVWIANAYPKAGLGVQSDDVMGRAHLNEVLSDLVTNIHDGWAPVFSPERFVIDADQRDGARQAAFRQLDEQYERLDRIMSRNQWTTLDRRTVADAYLYVACTWKDRAPTRLDAYPALAAFKVRLDGDEDV